MPHSTALGRTECEREGCDVGASIVVDGQELCGTHAKEAYNTG